MVGGESRPDHPSRSRERDNNRYRHIVSKGRTDRRKEGASNAWRLSGKFSIKMTARRVIARSYGSMVVDNVEAASQSGRDVLITLS
jgi:hypothetical protein